jgi:hypothetical protein
MIPATARVSWSVLALASITVGVFVSATSARLDATALARGAAPVVETYEVGDLVGEAPTLLVAEGGVWAVSGDDVRRVDIDSGPFSGGLGSPFPGSSGTPRFDGDTYWTVVIDPNAPPCGGAIPEEDPQQPFVLHGTDLATNTVTRAIPLPEWCAPRPSRASWSGAPPTVAAADGNVWVGRSLPPRQGASLNAASVRVDRVTGAVSPVAATGPLATIVADDGGAWGYALAEDDRTLFSVIGHELTTAAIVRLNRDGTVVATDLLRGAASDPGSITPDPGGVWLVTARPGRPLDVRPDTTLTRVTTRGRITATRIHAWSVASGDGQTWYVGATSPIRSTPGNTDDDSLPAHWVLGRIDTQTAKLIATYHLNLPAELRQVTAMDGAYIDLLGVTGDSVWLRATKGSITLVRVTVPDAAHS